MCLFTSSVTVTVEFSLCIMDFRGRRPGKDGMPVKGVDFGKILALLSLKMFLQFIPAKQRFHSSTSLKFSRDARAEAVSRQKEIFLVQVVLSLFFASNFAMYM